MKRSIQFLFVLLGTISGFAQIQVTTVIDDVKASGGVTAAPGGNLIISDFGRSLNSQGEETKIYEFDPRSGSIQLFGDGFSGASGAAFDQEGNFYHSSPKGHKISRRSKEGVWELNRVVSKPSISDENRSVVFKIIKT